MMLRTIRARVILTAIAASAWPAAVPSTAGEPRPITAEERNHWAFTPPVRPEPPEVEEPGRVRDSIDRFILSALDGKGLRQAPEADRATLLRRLSFDLIGLPPAPEDVEAFEQDRSPRAYEKQVDRLLTDPRHGERWGQHWLDLARYADTDGFEFDQARPDAWRYRDWVVRALNADLPYDRFVGLQLAGDELEPNDPDAFIATGFNRCYPDMVDLNDQGLRRQNALNDITETTGLVFLGLTIGCARCHDHKFDPIRLDDFYRIQAFFTPARFRDDYVLGTELERRDHERRRRDWEDEVASVQSELIALEHEARERLAPGSPTGLDDATATAFQKASRERTSAEVNQVFVALDRDRRIKPAALERAIGSEGVARRSGLLARLKSLRSRIPPELPRARGLDEAGPAAPATFTLVRGDHATKGRRVEPAVPDVLLPVGGADSASPAPTIRPLARSTGRRKALAGWLTRPGHPLASRVIVNRLWQHHFGRGLVATASDFGTMGDVPSSPRLLDWLATELERRSWSLKELHRLIVTSATYRQATASTPEARREDPENLLLSRQNRRRLDGEAIRDALLAASGRLNPAMGGHGVFPELPPELARLSSKGAVWPVSADAGDRARRSLYVFVRRNLRYPFFEAFDRPDTNASCPRRPVTTIAPQALSLLNGSLPVESARSLAARLDREAVAAGAGSSRAARIDRAYRLCLARPPDAEERAMALDFIAHGGTSAWAEFCLALLNLNEFVYLD